MEPYIIISENRILEFISLSLTIIFWTGYFTPIQSYRFQLTHWLSNLIVRRGWFYLHPVLTFINCNKCLGFWGGWLYYWDIRLGMLLSVSTFLLGKLIAYAQGAEGGDSK